MQDTRTILQRELNQVRTKISELEKTLQEKPDFGLGKGNPATARREVDRALLQRLKQRAKNLEQALSRLSQGLYGICVQCGKPIHPERLAALPDATSCIDCAQGIGLRRKKRGTASLRKTR